MFWHTPPTVGRYWDLHWHPSVFRRKHGTSVRTHVTAKQHQSIASPGRFLSCRNMASAWGSPSMSTWKIQTDKHSLAMKLLLPAPYFHQKHTSLKCSLQPCNPAQWSSVCGLSTAIHEKRQRRHQNLHLELAKTWAYRLHYAARMYINVHIIYCQIHQEKKLQLSRAEGTKTHGRQKRLQSLLWRLSAAVQLGTVSPCWPRVVNETC